MRTTCIGRAYFYDLLIMNCPLFFLNKEHSSLLETFYNFIHLISVNYKVHEFEIMHCEKQTVLKIRTTCIGWCNKDVISLFIDDVL